MRIGFQTHRYDPNDYINGCLVYWIDELAKHVDEVHVMTLDKPAIAPTRPNIFLAGHHRGRTRLHTVGRFYHNALRLASKVDCFFIWQGGHYPGLLRPVKFLTGKPQFQWKANARAEWRQKLYGRWCSDITFTSSKSSYPGGGHVEVVGQAIDTEHFRPDFGCEKEYDFVTVGRINGTKRFQHMIGALALCKEWYGKDYSLAIVGPMLNEKDRHYKQDILDLIERWNVDARFVGPVTRSEMPGWIRKGRVLLNCGVGAFDRINPEAMACGIPVISSCELTPEAMPGWSHKYIVIKHNVKLIAGRMVWLMTRGQAELDLLGTRLRYEVKRLHGLDKLWFKILPHMEDVCSKR